MGGRPLVAWCLRSFQACTGVNSAVIAAPPGFEAALRDAAEREAPDLEAEVVAGAGSRSGSVARALAAAGEPELVVVHDAARPLVTVDLIERCLAELERKDCDGVVAAARATDAIKEADRGGRVSATLDRERLWVVQTPQAFRTRSLRAAFSSQALERAHDDAQLVEAAGGAVRIVEAPRENLKVTTALDLRVAALLLAERA